MNYWSGRILTALSCLVLISGCATTFNAEHHYDPAHDFSSYKTFAWISENPMRSSGSVGYPLPRLESMIMAEIEPTLLAKGYEKIDDASEADFVMSFTLGARSKIQVQSYPSVGMQSARWGTGYYGYKPNTYETRYREGMLAIDVFDVQQAKPVWHGYATSEIDNKVHEDLPGTIKAAVESVLSEFPPDP
jgi:hypothetical protein